jgi:hypothetical protein
MAKKRKRPLARQARRSAAAYKKPKPRPKQKPKPRPTKPKRTPPKKRAPRAVVQLKAVRKLLKKRRKLKGSYPKPTAKQKARPSTSLRLRGNSVQVKVNSLHAGKNITIIRKTTNFEPPFRVPKGQRGARLLASRLKPIARRHVEAIGKSIKDLIYLRIQYVFTRDREKLLSHYSIGIAKLDKLSYVERYVDMLIENFLNSLSGYARDGFSAIRISGFIVQGYKK